MNEAAVPQQLSDVDDEDGPFESSLSPQLKGLMNPYPPPYRGKIKELQGIAQSLETMKAQRAGLRGSANVSPHVRQSTLRRSGSRSSYKRNDGIRKTVLRS